MAGFEPGSAATATGSALSAVYEEIDVRELAEEPGSFKGRRVSVSGRVDLVEVRESGCLVHLDVPVAGGAHGEMRAVVVEYRGETVPLSLGQSVTVRGVCEDIHVIAVPDRCGIIVVPLLRAVALESEAKGAFS